MTVKSESEATHLCLTLATPRTAAYQAPLSMGFSRQKYWSGVPSPSPREDATNMEKMAMDEPRERPGKGPFLTDFRRDKSC